MRSFADIYFRVFTRRRRNLLLLFAAGLMWGYVAKALMHTHTFVGFYDPYIMSSSDIYRDTDLQKPVMRSHSN